MENVRTPFMTIPRTNSMWTQVYWLNIDMIGVDRNVQRFARKLRQEERHGLGKLPNIFEGVVAKWAKGLFAQTSLLLGECWVLFRAKNRPFWGRAECFSELKIARFCFSERVCLCRFFFSNQKFAPVGIISSNQTPSFSSPTKSDRQSEDPGSIPGGAALCYFFVWSSCQFLSLSEKKRKEFDLVFLLSPAWSSRHVYSQPAHCVHFLQPSSAAWSRRCFAVAIKVAPSFWFLNINMPIFCWNRFQTVSGRRGLNFLAVCLKMLTK